MKLAIVDPNYSDAWVEAHKAGCQHLGKRKPVHYTIEAETKTDAAKQIGQDFINEGSMDLAAVLSNISFAPCVKFSRIA